MITENAEWTAKVFYLKTSRILVFALEILVEGTQNLENDSVTETVATAKLHLRWADQIRRWSVAGLPALTLERTGTIRLLSVILADWQTVYVDWLYLIKVESSRSENCVCGRCYVKLGAFQFRP